MTLASWASVADVQNITRKTVTEDDVMSAQADIDLYSNRTFAASGVIRLSDQRWLKAAVAWQSVWLKSQPGYEGRSSVSQFAQDGLSAVYTSKDAIVLGPRAMRALRNLSWKRSRTINIRSPFTSGGSSEVYPAGTPAFDDPATDNYRPI